MLLHFPRSSRGCSPFPVKHQAHNALEIGTSGVWRGKELPVESSRRSARTGILNKILDFEISTEA